MAYKCLKFHILAVFSAGYSRTQKNNLFWVIIYIIIFIEVDLLGSRSAGWPECSVPCRMTGKTGESVTDAPPAQPSSTVRHGGNTGQTIETGFF